MITIAIIILTIALVSILLFEDFSIETVLFSIMLIAIGFALWVFSMLIDGAINDNDVVKPIDYTDISFNGKELVWTTGEGTGVEVHSAESNMVTIVEVDGDDYTLIEREQCASKVTWMFSDCMHLVSLYTLGVPKGSNPLLGQ